MQKLRLTHLTLSVSNQTALLAKKNRIYLFTIRCSFRIPNPG